MLIAIFVLVAVIIFFVVIIIADCNRFVVREYTIESDKIEKDCSIVFLSDLHNSEFGKNNCRLTEAIRNINPDVVVCGGDMITATPGESVDKALTFLQSISNYKIIYGIGNHEYRMKLYTEDYGDLYIRYKEALQAMGVTVLENESEDLMEYNIRFQGIMIDRSFYKRFGKCEMDSEYVESLIGVEDSNAYCVFLAHNPEYFPQYSNAGADLVLAGHVHGGIMRLPLLGGVISPRLRLFPKYDGGLFEENCSKMILSRGLGTHTIPIRVFNPGELDVITLKSVK